MSIISVFQSVASNVQTVASNVSSLYQKSANDESVLNTYDFYVKSYLTQIRKSSESTLKCAELVFNASQQLSNPEFKKFCDAIRATPTFITKMKKIHENKERIIAMSDNQLTASYTVMYELSILSDEELTTLKEEKKLNENTSIKDVNKVKTKKPKSDQIDAANENLKKSQESSNATLDDAVKTIQNPPTPPVPASPAADKTMSEDKIEFSPAVAEVIRLFKELTKDERTVALEEIQIIEMFLNL